MHRCWTPSHLAVHLVGHVALDGGGRCTARGAEQLGRRATGNDAIGDAISVSLVRIADLADPALHACAGLLLHDVRSFMRREPQARRLLESYAVALRIALRADLLAGRRRATADSRAHTGQIMWSERLLDAMDVRQRRRARSPVRCNALDLPRGLRACSAASW